MRFAAHRSEVCESAAEEPPWIRLGSLVVVFVVAVVVV
jgi:hypothetical protein